MRGKAFRVEPPLPSALEGIPTPVSSTSHPLGWLEPERHDRAVEALKKPRALLVGKENGVASLENSLVAPDKDNLHNYQERGLQHIFCGGHNSAPNDGRQMIDNSVKETNKIVSQVP